MRPVVQDALSVVTEIPGRLLVVGILLFFLLPLQSSAAIVLMSLLLLAALRRQKDARAEALDGLWLPAVAMGLTLLIGLVFSFEPHESVRALGKLFPALLFLGLVLQAIRRSWFADGRAFVLAAGIGCLAAVLVFLVSQAWYGGYVSRTDGLSTLDLRNGTSVALLIVLCALMAVYLSLGKTIALLAGVVLLWIIMANGGRGAFVAGLAVLAWAVLRRLRLRLYVMVLALAAAALVVGGAIWLWGLPSGMDRSMQGGFLTGRGSLWLAACQIIREHPFVGIGINAWKSSPYVHSLSNGWINQPSPHNFALDLLSSVGIIGALSFLAACTALIWRLHAAVLQVAAEFRAFGGTLLVGFLVNALVDFRVFSAQFFAVAGVGLVLAFAGGHPLRHRA